MVLSKVAAATLALPLAALGLHARSDPVAQLAQTDGGLTAVQGEASEWWPKLRRARHASGPYAEEEAESQSRMAVLVSGALESLILTPLLSNVVRANVRNGLQVDLFFSLVAPVKGMKPSVASDPKIANLLRNFDEVSYHGKLMDLVCDLAKRQGATHCVWDLERNDAVRAPKNSTYRKIMTQVPLMSDTGLETIANWRSHSALLGRVRDMEGDDEYDAVMVTRANGYWMAPRVVSIEDFQADPLHLSTMPCLDETGINDNAAIMGREAADIMLGAFEAWQQGDVHLHGTRTAEEVWFRMASHGGLNIVPEPMYAAQALYTASGLPCFQESTFNVNSEQQRLEQCFAESAGEAPMASLFSAFSCETMDPNFFDLLWPQQVSRLHQVIADITNRNESNAIVLAVIDHDEVELAVKMLTSLQEAGGDAKSVVVGTSAGVCKALANTAGVAGHKCFVVVPAQDVRLSVFKHAILTTVAVAGLSDKIVYASPRATFASSLASQLAASDKRILFGKSTASAKGCIAEAGSVGEIDGCPGCKTDAPGVLYLSDAPEVTDMLLRAWQEMAESKSVSQGEALASALVASGYSDFGFLSCGMRLSEEPESDRVVEADSPPGVTEQIAREVRKASESTWVDRFRAEASKERRAKKDGAVTERQRQQAWQTMADEWKETWAKRVADLQEANNYNATEVAEERRKRRMEQRKAKKATHKKHVRYLPPDEAAKVKAREDKWEADVAKQKADDAEKAEARKEAFRRQVEEAQKIIENRRKEKQQRAAEDQAADDELSAA
ncbi:unnamed protein product [Prorocentrum cordatum]|uniref:Uncharacterized protein n=1 Tax=Prorocentrum cordatum TaxID=2364126 RepID=A0ABN9SAA8_9DINO|nr:unnamed protein product [Polarella glacialis]